MPKVSSVTINWNGLEDTLTLIGSLKRSEYPLESIIVVDNASLNDEAGTIERETPEVIVLRQAENLGFSGGCNVGIRAAFEAGSDLVMLVNNDSIVPPEMTGKLVENFLSIEDAGALSPVILRDPDRDTVWFSGAEWRSSFATGETGFQLESGDSYGFLKDLPPYRSEFACGCCLMVSRQVVESVGYFDERYFAFYDEAEWCARMAKRGFQSYVVPEAHMFHKVGGSTPGVVMTYLMSRNRLLWMKENLPLRSRIKALPSILKESFWHLLNHLGLISESKRYSTRSSSLAYLLGIRDYFRGAFGKWDEPTGKKLLEMPD